MNEPGELCYVGVSYSRGSMGVEFGRTESCSICRYTKAKPTARLNLDGVWTYLCRGCIEHLVALFVDLGEEEV